MRAQAAEGVGEDGTANGAGKGPTPYFDEFCAEGPKFRFATKPLCSKFVACRPELEACRQHCAPALIVQIPLIPLSRAYPDIPLSSVFSLAHLFNVLLLLLGSNQRYFAVAFFCFFFLLPPGERAVVPCSNQSINRGCPIRRAKDLLNARFF